MNVVLDRIEQAITNLKARGASELTIVGAIRAVIHSPAVALLVTLTPNKADDATLELLKALFPKSGS